MLAARRVVSPVSPLTHSYTAIDAGHDPDRTLQSNPVNGNLVDVSTETASTRRAIYASHRNRPIEKSNYRTPVHPVAWRKQPFAAVHTSFLNLGLKIIR
jgi:hypothetical protein